MTEDTRFFSSEKKKKTKEPSKPNNQANKQTNKQKTLKMDIHLCLGNQVITWIIDWYPLA